MCSSSGKCNGLTLSIIWTEVVHEQVKSYKKPIIYLFVFLLHPHIERPVCPRSNYSCTFPGGHGDTKGCMWQNGPVSLLWGNSCLTGSFDLNHGWQCEILREIILQNKDLKCKEGNHIRSFNCQLLLLRRSLIEPHVKICETADKITGLKLQTKY